MSTVLEQPVTLHPSVRPLADRLEPPAAARWSVQDVQALFELPFTELLYRAQTVYRAHFDPTLVEFALQPAPNGTLLVITESGFDKVPAARRDEAFRMNERGWSAQIDNIARHVG